MTEDLLLEPQPDPGDTCVAELSSYRAEPGTRASTGPALPFPHDSDRCALMVQPSLLLRELAYLATGVFPPDIRVHADVPTELWQIRGDPGAIHQALFKVLSNARAAMPEGGHVALSARNVTVHDVPDTPFFDAQAGDYVEIAIGDTGPAIDEDGAELSSRPGFAQVARVLRHHGGYTRIESRAGQGTTVSLYLPRAARQTTATDPVAGTAMHPVGRILMVDDEVAILGLNRRILERAGYDVLVAHDGFEALALFERHHAEIGLVLTDLAMPGMNGFTLVWALRRSKPELRVMVATGQGTEDNLRELERMGVRQVLLKPYSPHLLLEAVSQALAEPAQCEPDLFLVGHPG
jgi:CheY-like chemotaxis protein